MYPVNPTIPESCAYCYATHGWKSDHVDAPECYSLRERATGSGSPSTPTWLKLDYLTEQRIVIVWCSRPLLSRGIGGGITEVRTRNRMHANRLLALLTSTLLGLLLLSLGEATPVRAFGVRSG